VRREKNKLTATKIRALNDPGFYNDGFGLNLQVRRFWSVTYTDDEGKTRSRSFDKEEQALAYRDELRTEALIEPYATKSWLFRYLRAGKDRKFGLGSIETTSLARARELAQEQRETLRQGSDPIDHAEAKRTQRKLDASRAMRFKQCADAYIKANRAAWGNEKHAAQWASTFNGTKAATAAINDLPVSEIDTGLVLKVLEPIWTAKPETASRVRGRIETVLDWAKVRGFRDGENPARWRGHLDHILPKKSKVAVVEHHNAVPYRDAKGYPNSRNPGRRVISDPPIY
jgi:hypothetical protein